MPIQTLIKPSEYHDSVSLMSAAQEIARLPGVTDAAVVMATEANKGILKEAGLVRANENGLRVSYCIVPEALKRFKALLGAL